MKIVKRILIALLGLLLLLILVGYVYVRSTAPSYQGVNTVPGLTDEVQVHFDAYGIPHIYATNMEDAYAALGYVHAQDRLFQMEMLSRAAGGRLSEVLGKDLLPVDKLFRTLGLNVFAKENAQRFMSADTAEFQRAAKAYQQGVNAFVRDGKTPLEFSIIGIPKTEFTPEDIYLALGFMSLGFAEGMKVDPVLEKIRTELGEAYLNDLAVHSPPNAVRIKSYKGPAKRMAADPLITGLHKALGQLPIPLWVGSNGWVIAGNRTKSGLPILANDTHIGFSQPAVWYEAHMEYPGVRLYGHYLAGVPFAFLGNNDFCGWGLTMFENDDTDFFKETLNPNDSNQVRFGDQWEPLQRREEVISVKDGKDVVFSVQSSRHGPLINGIMEKTVSSATPVSLWWSVNHQPNEALEAAYRLNRAKSFDEAQGAMSLFSAPGLNVMYGDVDGNIAWCPQRQLAGALAHVDVVHAEIQKMTSTIPDIIPSGANPFAPRVIIERPVQMDVTPAKPDSFAVDAGKVGFAADPGSETAIQRVIPDVQLPDVGRVDGADEVHRRDLFPVRPRHGVSHVDDVFVGANAVEGRDDEVWELRGFHLQTPTAVGRAANGALLLGPAQSVQSQGGPVVLGISAGRQLILESQQA